MTTEGHLHISQPALSGLSATFLKVGKGAHLPDDRVVCGGDGVEDALDAPQRLLTPRGDAVKGFVIVLQRATALTEGRGKIGSSPLLFYVVESEILSTGHSRAHL